MNEPVFEKPYCDDCGDDFTEGERVEKPEAAFGWLCVACASKHYGQEGRVVVADYAAIRAEGHSQ